eukprot:TRINITY_DN6271_c0_g1_i5.p1 TRINITY_DN6271_c0_g1~~TRINITY_DN6271_c0_g1_i5.p1  ORF type:complete len:362 (+),score=71.03 TRINITY_DN6271_c0_g1_i5:101-1186(+)
MARTLLAPLLLLLQTLSIAALRTTPSSSARDDWQEAMTAIARKHCEEPRVEYEVTHNFVEDDWVLKLSCKRCSHNSVIRAGFPDEIKEADAWLHHLDVENYCAKILTEWPSHKVVAIRHGQSRWNKNVEKYGLLAQSWGMMEKYTDSPLSDFGLRQAQRLASLIAKASETSTDASEVYSDAAPPPKGSADEAVQLEAPVVGAAGSASQLSNLAAAAMSEFPKNLENLAQIRVKGKVLTDDMLLPALRQHDEEIKILSGQDCEATNFVSSQLTRAMDTLNLALLPAATRCANPYAISSNMQEFEHNADCSARTPERDHPRLQPVRLATMDDSYNFIEHKLENTLIDEQQTQYRRVDMVRVAT